MEKPKFTESQIDFMRADVESNFSYTKIIEIAKKVLESQGRDFDTEYEKFKKGDLS